MGANLPIRGVQDRNDAQYRGDCERESASVAAVAAAEAADQWFGSVLRADVAAARHTESEADADHKPLDQPSHAVVKHMNHSYVIVKLISIVVHCNGVAITLICV